MTSVKDLAAAIVTSVQAVSGFIDDLGGIDNVRALDLELPPNRNVAEALNALEETGALLVCQGINQGYRGTVQRWKFNWVLYLKAPGDFAEDVAMGAPGTHPGYFDLFQKLIDGESVDSGLRWLDTTIHTSFDPPDEVTFQPHFDKAGTQFWGIHFSLMEIFG